ncbi:3'-5' exonuclease [Sorangium sp. So ce887]|uniref:3'-5' exonuclease n=1 Tax=Sorangium sp. So ce887 TaxID=3133324 RepID=UPI003F5F2DC5
MKFLIADTFTKSLARLDAQSQGAIKQAAFDFQVNPASPGFKLHRLDRAKDKDFWSFRVNKDLRIIVHKSESSFALCYADHHDAAYAWAEARRLEVHPQTGAAQFVEVKERIEEVVRQVVRAAEGEPALFAKHETDYLLALGVPPEWLDAVRAVGETGIEKLFSHLPAEAAERLLQLACGEPVPRPVPVTTQDPFEHPDARRRFRVLDSQDELRRALDAPWEQWLVFLHPTQRAVVERKFKGPARVTGGAGTGKSVVAIHRAAHLLKADPGARVLLTTYSRTLAVRLGHSADLLLGSDTKERRRLAVDHLHKIARDISAQSTGKPLSVLDPEKQLGGLIETAKGRVAPSVDLSVAFLRSEWNAVVDPWGLRSWPAYKGVSRAGRATPLGAKQRLVIWKIFEELQRLLAERRLTTWPGLCYVAAERLYDARPYDHVIADECQDFGPAELTLLRALADPGPDDLFLCSDAGQRIYRAAVAWSSAGIDVRGRSTRLSNNYRTTDQIRRFSDRILPEAMDEGDGEKEKRSTVSVLNGPHPDVQGFATVAKEAEGVAGLLKNLLASGYKPRDVAIFGRSERVLRDRVEPALARAGLTGHPLSDDQPPSAADVSVGTIHRAKGLEFKVVVVVGCDADVVPATYLQKELVDEADREAFLEQERHLLYVACTRARERLVVTYAGTPSRWVGAPGG